MPPTAHDIQRADAVLQLATSLSAYGQHERVLSLLNLHDWLVAGRDLSSLLRINTLLRLHRYADAKQVCDATGVKLPPALMATIHWGLGEQSLGDAEFQTSLTG